MNFCPSFLANCPCRLVKHFLANCPCRLVKHFLVNCPFRLVKHFLVNRRLVNFPIFLVNRPIRLLSRSLNLRRSFLPLTDLYYFRLYLRLINVLYPVRTQPYRLFPTCRRHSPCSRQVLWYLQAKLRFECRNNSNIRLSNSIL